jgi:hypothetical protein
MFVIALRFAFRRLVLFAEMAAADSLRSQGVDAHQFSEFEEIGHAAGLFEALLRSSPLPGTVHVLQNSSRNCADLADGRVRPSALRDMPQ